MIVAFPDSHSDSFPMLEKVNLHSPKVDIGGLSEDYKDRQSVLNCIRRLALDFHSLHNLRLRAQEVNRRLNY